MNYQYIRTNVKYISQDVYANCTVSENGIDTQMHLLVNYPGQLYLAHLNLLHICQSTKRWSRNELNQTKRADGLGLHINSSNMLIYKCTHEPHVRANKESLHVSCLFSLVDSSVHTEKLGTLSWARSLQIITMLQFNIYKKKKTTPWKINISKFKYESTHYIGNTSEESLREA